MSEDMDKREPRVTAAIDQAVATHNATIQDIRNKVVEELNGGTDPIRVWGSLTVQLHRAYGLRDDQHDVAMAFASAVFPAEWWATCA